MQDLGWISIVAWILTGLLAKPIILIIAYTFVCQTYIAFILFLKPINNRYFPLKTCILCKKACQMNFFIASAVFGACKCVTKVFLEQLHVFL